MKDSNMKHLIHDDRNLLNQDDLPELTDEQKESLKKLNGKFEKDRKKILEKAKINKE